MSEDYVRTRVKAFNEHGFKMLQPKWGPGRPSRFTEEQRKGPVVLALSRPKDLGLPYTQWSLSRLREEAMNRGVVDSISEEWLRVLLLDTAPGREDPLQERATAAAHLEEDVVLPKRETLENRMETR
jgi:hypothetical protein